MSEPAKQDQERDIAVYVVIRDGRTGECWANAHVSEEELQGDHRKFALAYLEPAFLAARIERNRRQTQSQTTP